MPPDARGLTVHQLAARVHRAAAGVRLRGPGGGDPGAGRSGPAPPAHPGGGAHGAADRGGRHPRGLCGNVAASSAYDYHLQVSASLPKMNAMRGRLSGPKPVWTRRSALTLVCTSCGPNRPLAAAAHQPGARGLDRRDDGRPAPDLRTRRAAGPAARRPAAGRRTCAWCWPRDWSAARPSTPLWCPSTSPNGPPPACSSSC